MTIELTTTNPQLIEALRFVGVVGKGDRVHSIVPMFDSGRNDEGWVYGYAVTSSGGILNLKRKINVKEKNMISISRLPSVVAQDHLARAVYLADCGLRIPKIFGVYGGALYQEFIVNDRTEETYQKIKSGPPNEALNELIKIASRLDKLGFQPLNFLSDVMFDGDRKHFYIIDVGSDLGVPQNYPGSRALNSLVTRFPNHSDYITGRYHQITR